MNRNLSAIYLTIFSQDRHGAASLCLLTIIPRARMGSESMRAKGIVVFSKIQIVGKKYRDETTLASKARFSRHCCGFQIQRFSLLVGYNIYPDSSSTNQNAALIIDHWLDFTKCRYRNRSEITFSLHAQKRPGYGKGKALARCPPREDHDI